MLYNMFMSKITYKFRIYPTKHQERLLSQNLEECRWLYNYFLEQRKTSYESDGKSLSLYDQIKQLPSIKNNKPSLKCVYSNVLQNVPVRIDLAFQAFFRRAKNKENPGYPRFRGKDRYDSICYPQYGNGCKVTGNILHLSKIGDVYVVKHREIEGVPKNITVKKSSTDKWYITIVCDNYEPEPLPKIDNSIGIDVGLESFATYSDGTKIINPRFFRKEEKELAKVQRKLSKQSNGSKERAKTRKAVSKIHERIKNKRNNFCHQLSRKIVNEFNTICVEDLNINNMLKTHCLAKSISDAGWRQFVQFLIYKAEYADRQVVQINPAYTSQDCSQCGYRVSKKLGDRMHNCPNCGLSIDRDVNASLNVLRIGTYSQIKTL